MAFITGNPVLRDLQEKVQLTPPIAGMVQVGHLVNETKDAYVPPFAGLKAIENGLTAAAPEGEPTPQEIILTQTAEAALAERAPAYMRAARGFLAAATIYGKREEWDQYLLNLVRGRNAILEAIRLSQDGGQGLGMLKQVCENIPLAFELAVATKQTEVEVLGSFGVVDNLPEMRGIDHSTVRIVTASTKRARGRRDMQLATTQVSERQYLKASETFLKLASESTEAQIPQEKLIRYAAITMLAVLSEAITMEGSDPATALEKYHAVGQLCSKYVNVWTDGLSRIFMLTEQQGGMLLLSMTEKAKKAPLPRTPAISYYKKEINGGERIPDGRIRMAMDVLNGNESFKALSDAEKTFIVKNLFREYEATRPGRSFLTWVEEGFETRVDESMRMSKYVAESLGILKDYGAEGLYDSDVFESTSLKEMMKK